MARFTTAELKKFRQISNCEQCVHYQNCPFWMSLLLVNEEPAHTFFRLMMPDITKPCIMFARRWWSNEENQER